MKLVCSVLLSLVLFNFPLLGQDANWNQIDATRGEVGELSLGFIFVPPSGWIAQKSAEGYILGAQTKKGVILILPHTYGALNELQAAAQEGLADESGTMLKLQGQPQAFGQNGLEAEFSGTVEWQPTQAHTISLLSPHGGGVTILNMVEETSFSEEYVRLTRTVANSVRFFKPVAPAVDEEWRNLLSGARLTYMWSYNSGSADGSYAGGSQQTIIDLCEKGYFRYSDNNQMAIDGGYGSGYSTSGYGGGSDQGQGEWIVTIRSGLSILQLKFNDGKILEYQLSYQDGKTFLDDKRYFRTYADDPAEEHRPQCW